MVKVLAMSFACKILFKICKTFAFTHEILKAKQNTMRHCTTDQDILCPELTILPL